MKVLRPRYKKSNVPFRWAHIDDGHFAPLCGKTYGNEYVLIGSEEDGLLELGRDHICPKCAAKHLGFEYVVIQAGQERRYADSWYKYELRDNAEEPRDREEVLAFCRKWLHESYSRDSMKHPFAPQLIKCAEVAPRCWHYHVRMLYTG